MSIAVTIVIAPSRRLRLLLAGFGASLFAAACAVGFVASLQFGATALVVAALLFAGACVLRAALRPATVHRIDISGVGQLRLTVQQDVRPEAAETLPVRLLPSSTLWPRLMLLRFGAADASRGRFAWQARACRNVVVLPDSLAPEAFRALAVALGGLAAQAASPTERKIL